jgi:hypothetical protein
MSPVRKAKQNYVACWLVALSVEITFDRKFEFERATSTWERWFQGEVHYTCTLCLSALYEGWLIYIREVTRSPERSTH